MTRFGDTDRAKLFYFVNNQFRPAQVSRAGIYGGFHGGPEQSMLEKLLRERLGVFRLSRGQSFSVEDELKQFITSAPDEQLITMLELMPIVAAKLSGQGIHRGDPLGLATKIENFLAEIGIDMRFSRGRLEAITVDQAPLALKALPDRESLKRELESRAGGLAISIVFIDLDNFKGVNDRKGHQAGDACLENVVAFISEAAVGKGKTYRYGGDEFAVMLPNFTAHEGAAVAERIRRVIDENPPDPDVKVTVSIGVAASDQGLASADALLDAADQAAYASKFTGKNKVTCWPLDADSLAARLAKAREEARGR